MMENIYEILSKENGITLAKDIYLPVDKRGNINTLVVGGSGSGKSASFIIPNILNMLGSYVVTDPLGELYERTHEYLEENGYEVRTVGIENSKNNYNYDPFNHINDYSDVDKLAEILIGEEQDDFWNESAKALLKTVIYYVLDKAEKKDLLTVFYLLTTKKEELFEKFNEFEPCSRGAKYAALLKAFPEKTYASTVSTAVVKLAFIIDKVEDDRNYKKEFEFSDLKKKKMAIFIGFKEDSKTDCRQANIIVSQMLSQLSLRGDVNEKVYFLLDGVGMLGKIMNLPSSVLLARANNLSLSLISNNVNNLKYFYGDDFYAMLNTVDTQLLLGTNLKSDYEYFGELFSVEPEKIKERMDNDTVLISEKGLGLIEGQKAYFFQRPEFKDL